MKVLNLLFLILFLVLILIFHKKTFRKEGFYPNSIQIQNADPLELEKTKFNLYPKSGWIKDLEGKVYKIIKIRAVEGQIDFENVMYSTSFQSGLNYDYQNKSQGTNMFFYQNTARHGNRGYFQWKTTKKWNSLPDDKKRTEIDIKIIINPNTIDKPDFPVSFSMQIPDFNYNKSSRVWFVLYGNPIATQNEAHFIPPLRLKYHKILVPYKNWIINNDTAFTKIFLQVIQGDFNKKDIHVDSKINWSLQKNNSGNYYILLKVKKNKDKLKPLKFTFKDKQYNQDVFLTVILSSPFNFSFSNQPPKPKLCY